MSQKTALTIILVIGIAGMSFSGYLTYTELWLNSPLKCPTAGGAPGTILGYPACVYGFFMYLLVVITTLLGLFSKNSGQPTPPTV